MEQHLAANCFFALSSALNAAARLLISSWLNSAACSPDIKGGTCGVGGRSHHGCRRLFLKVFRGGGRGWMAGGNSSSAWCRHFKKHIPNNTLNCGKEASSTNSEEKQENVHPSQRI